MLLRNARVTVAMEDPVSNHEHLVVGLEGRPGHVPEYSMLKPTALGLLIEYLTYKTIKLGQLFSIFMCMVDHLKDI